MKSKLKLILFAFVIFTSLMFASSCTRRPDVEGVIEQAEQTVEIPETPTDIKVEEVEDVEGVTVETEKIEVYPEEVLKEAIEEITPVFKADPSVIKPIEEEPLFYLSNYQRWVVECMVTGESIGEPYDGQIAVAQCILNACIKGNMQPSDVRKAYKYSGWNENITESVKKAVSAVFDEGYKITDEPILYFYAPKSVKSKWHESQNFVIEIGGHRFFSERG